MPFIVPDCDDSNLVSVELEEYVVRKSFQIDASKLGIGMTTFGMLTCALNRIFNFFSEAGCETRRNRFVSSLSVQYIQTNERMENYLHSPPKDFQNSSAGRPFTSPDFISALLFRASERVSACELSSAARGNASSNQMASFSFSDSGSFSTAD
jgi:hypothetical protein